MFDCSRPSNHSSPSEPLFPGGASLKSWNFGVSCCSKKNQNAPRPSESVVVVFKVNGSHHGDNPLLRPTGIQMATKSYATLQAMAPTNNKTVHQTSFTPYREQPRLTRIVVAYPRPAFSATNRTNKFQPF